MSLSLKIKAVNFWEAVAVLTGTIIGAGVLGLPFVIAKLGALPGLAMLLVLGLASLILNLMFAEVILRTRYRHQLAGYARKYLGKFAFTLETVSFLVGGFGALTAYLIGEGKVLTALFGGSEMTNALIFFVVTAIILFAGLKILKVFELWMVLALLVVVFSIFIFGFSSVDLSNYKNIQMNGWLVAYGVILFAYGGAASIVPLREILRGHEQQVKRAVIVATVIPIVVYILFSLIVVGVTGLATTEVATVGLGEKLGQYMIIFGNLFAFFAMGTSFLTIGNTLKEFLHYDLKLSRIVSWVLTLIVPLSIFLFVARGFIDTLGVVGGLAFGLSGIILVLMFWRAKKRGDRLPEFHLSKLKIVGGALVLMFLFGLVYTVYGFLN
ncbi:MAG: aromatic amino acid transport family protein [Patescibacteria group bacterium]